MSYPLSVAIDLGAAKTGLALSAQLVDALGVDSGGTVGTVTEIGTTGKYVWFYATVPDTHQGAVRFHAAGITYAVDTINPPLTVDLTPITASIATLQTDVTALGVAVANNGTNIATLQVDVTTLGVDVDAIASDVELVIADTAVDAATTPWQLVSLLRGTGELGSGTELRRQNLRQVSGPAIAATSEVVGSAAATPEISAINWNPQDNLANVRMAMLPHLLGQMYQESQPFQRLTRANVAGNSVGVIVDASDDTHHINAPDDASRPVLRQSSSPSNYLEFDGANNSLVVQNSKRAFKAIHNDVNFVLALKVRCRAGSDGVQFSLVDQANASSANVGITLLRQADGTLNYSVYNGTPGQKAASLATTGTLTEADGWTTILITDDGSAGTLTIGAKAAENITYPNTATTADATYDLRIGRRANSSDLFAKIDLSWLVVIEGQIVNSNDVLALLAYDHATVIGSQAKALSTGNLSFKQLSHAHAVYLADELASMFGEQARTTPVTSDGDAIGSMADYRSDRLLRILETTTSIDRPTLQVAQYNGLNAVRWDGVDDNLDLTEVFGKHGEWTILFVGFNADPVNGSHFMTGSQYFVKTAKNYKGTGGLDERYVLHLLGTDRPTFGKEKDSGGIGNGNEAMPGDVLFAVAIRRRLTEMTIFSQGIKGLPFQETLPFTVSNIGDNFVGLDNFHLDGDICGMGFYLAAHSDATIKSWFSQMASDYGITLLG